MLKQDLARAYFVTKGSRLRRVLDCVRNPAVHAIVVYRFGHWLLDKPFAVRLMLKPFFAWQYHRVRSKWGIEIGPEATIGPGLFIWHYGGIFVGGDVVAGENLILSHDVTIGFSQSLKMQGHPVLGDNVYIAPGAKLAGKIRVGDNVKIGANAVVERDVPDNALVQARPVQVVKFQDYYGNGLCNGPAGGCEPTDSESLAEGHRRAAPSMQ